MKRYTLRGLIHDAKIFNQLRLEYRRTCRQRASQTDGELYTNLSDLRAADQGFGNDGFSEVTGRMQLIS
jgi:hypothetical protein